MSQAGEGFHVLGMGLRGSHVQGGGWGEAQLGLADPMSGKVGRGYGQGVGCPVQ